MNDGGGGESSKGIESNLKKRRRGRNDEFAQSIARIAVAQVCESLGFQGFQNSALDTFSDIACKYIRDIGKMSNLYANSAGRTESNFFDIVNGLEDLGLSQGYVGASDINHCLSESGVVKEISQYVGVSEEIGFAYSIPSFPVLKERDSAQSFLQAGEVPPTDDIPPWLPRFPDPKTYTSLHSSSMKETELKLDRVDQEQKVIEQSSLMLKQRLVSNGSELRVGFEQGDNAAREQAHNPFLAQPLRPGEMEVSSISLPAKLMEEDVARNHGLWANHVSALETFAPTTQAIKSSEHDSEEGSKKALLNSRPAVQLTSHTGKNSINPKHIPKDRENSEAMSWFVNEEVNDDQKTRTVEMVKKAIDSGEHTGHDSVVN